MSCEPKAAVEAVKLIALTDGELKHAYHLSHEAGHVARHRMVAAEFARRAAENPAPDITRRTTPII